MIEKMEAMTELVSMIVERIEVLKILEAKEVRKGAYYKSCNIAGELNGLLWVYEIINGVEYETTERD